MNNRSRWQAFRINDDSIPSTPYEAAVFIQNAQLHLMSYGITENYYGAREILGKAHDEVNRTFFADTYPKEVA